MISTYKAGLIIGRGGSIIRNIERNTGTNIRVVGWVDEDGERKSVLIKGNKDQIECAKEEIETFKSSRSSDNWAPKLCQFYLRGKCINGNYCAFSHDERRKRNASPSRRVNMPIKKQN